MKTVQDPQATGVNLYFGKKPYIVERNLHILTLLSQDRKPAEIADELFVSVYTIRWCIDRMIKRNGYHSVTGLIAAAIRSHII